MLLTTQQPADGASVVETLRIQLSGTHAALEERELVGGADASAQAMQLVRSGRARLVAWIDTRAAGRYELRCVGLRQGAIAAARAELAGRPGPALERTMALKLRELLDELDAPAAPSPSSSRAPPHELHEESSRPAQPSAGQASARVSALLELATQATSGAGSVGPQLRAFVAGGVSHRLAGLQAELSLGLGWASGFTRVATIGSVEVREWMSQLALHVLQPGAGPTLGGHAGLVLRVVRARGETAAGERGEQSRLVPALGFGADAAIPLQGALRLRWTLGAELALKSQRFAVERVSLLELGNLRAITALSLVFWSL